MLYNFNPVYFSNTEYKYLLCMDDENKRYVILKNSFFHKETLSINYEIEEHKEIIVKYSQKNNEKIPIKRTKITSKNYQIDIKNDLNILKNLNNFKIISPFVPIIFFCFYKKFNMIIDKNIKRDILNFFKVEIENIEEELLFFKINKEEIAKLKSEKENFVRQLNNIVPQDIKTKNVFIPLTIFLTEKSDDFKGIYIIKNKINNKVYVGQSKNVLKRLRQHFDKDCRPKNVVFFEDYFKTDESQRQDLFDVLTIDCQTKDELDVLERKMILKYNSYEQGYNKTTGNL